MGPKVHLADASNGGRGCIWCLGGLTCLARRDVYNWRADIFVVELVVEASFRPSGFWTHGIMGWPWQSNIQSLAYSSERSI